MHLAKDAKDNQVIKLRASRGGSGTLFLQSAIAEVMVCFGLFSVELPSTSGVDIWVSRNRNP